MDTSLPIASLPSISSCTMRLEMKRKNQFSGFRMLTVSRERRALNTPPFITSMQHNKEIMEGCGTLAEYAEVHSAGGRAARPADLVYSTAWTVEAAP